MLIEWVEAYLHDRVAPIANGLDGDVAMLQQAFKALGEQNWLALKVPQVWGGAEVSQREFWEFQELVASYSGALAFLQAQHQSAGALISRSQNVALQREYLPGMGRGNRAIGVGFSHLRRSGEPALKALPVPDGYELSGFIPWITGYGIFQQFVGAAVLPDDRAVYGILPFTNTEANCGQIRFSSPMTLAAMTSTQTVTAELTQYFLPESQVLAITPANAIHKNDIQNVLQHSFYALGCARAGLGVMERVGQQRSHSFIQPTAALLNQEWQSCRQAIYGADSQPFQQRLQLRAWAIELAVRCAHAAVTVSAGAANSLDHPAQRIYREAMVFTVTGQTPAVMAATLARLTRSK